MPKNSTNSGKNIVSGTANMPDSTGSNMCTSVRERATSEADRDAGDDRDRIGLGDRGDGHVERRPQLAGPHQHAHLAPDQLRRRQEQLSGAARRVEYQAPNSATNRPIWMVRMTSLSRDHRSTARPHECRRALPLRERAAQLHANG